ncbi:hypothetical protein [Nocardioides sp.]|uniref:hypothetical protein n=1 Tax=Nocardioides sp. TaxID=35761 RepID=UPI00356846E5
MPVPIADSPLFSASDLGDLLDEEVSEARAMLVESVVWGWLKPVLKLDRRPNMDDPANAQIFSWALELGVVYAENPRGLSVYQLGEERTQYSVERRDAILKDAAETGSGSTGGALAPQGCFPALEPWPDQVRY